MFCTHCGQQLNFNNECTNEFCPSIINNATSSIDGFSKTEFAAFLGKTNITYYLNTFSIHNEKPKFISWNFSAFLFHWIWMFYRKMNVFASIYLSLYILGLIFLPPIAFIIISLLGHVLCGLFGNAVYKNYCLKRMSFVKPMSEKINPNSYNKMLQYYGGINIALTIFMSFIYSFLLLILLAFCIDVDTNYQDSSDNFERPFDYSDPYDDYDDPYDDYDDYSDYSNPYNDYNNSKKDTGSYI